MADPSGRDPKHDRDPKRGRQPQRASDGAKAKNQKGGGSTGDGDGACDVASDVALPGRAVLGTEGQEREADPGTTSRGGEPPAVLRGRVIDAFAQVVGHDGYIEAKVWDICQLAGVSTREFYMVFFSKQDCLFTAFRAGASLLSEYGERAYNEADGPWEQRLRAGLRTLLQILSVNPAFARLSIVEVVRAGPEGAAQLALVIDRWRWALGPQERDDLPSDVQANVPTVLAGGLVRLLVSYVRNDRIDRLPELVPSLTYFVALHVVGRQRAVRALDADRD